MPLDASPDAEPVAAEPVSVVLPPVFPEPVFPEEPFPPAVPTLFVLSIPLAVFPVPAEPFEVLFTP